MPASTTSEEGRLAALEALHVDEAPDDRFDRVTRLATRLFGVPMAAVALVGRDRWLAKSRQGLQVSDVVRTESFCDTTIREPDMLVVEDTGADSRFRDNPMVLGEPRVRFYAGQPLEAPGGYRVGTLCILDRTPRVLSAADRATLRDLALWVQKELAVDEELERAAAVQRGLLPQIAPVVAGYDIAGRCLPSRQVGGDLFDWYPVPGGMAFTVADVMGKGMAAAIVMATLKAVLRTGCRQGDLVEAVENASTTIESDFEDAAVFATVFLARLEVADGQVTYVDAGHGLTPRRPPRRIRHGPRRPRPTRRGDRRWATCRGEVAARPRGQPGAVQRRAARSPRRPRRRRAGDRRGHGSRGDGERRRRPARRTGHARASRRRHHRRRNTEDELTAARRQPGRLIGGLLVVLVTALGAPAHAQVPASGPTAGATPFSVLRLRRDRHPRPAGPGRLLPPPAARDDAVG